MYEGSGKGLMTRKKKRYKKKNASLLFFVLFILIAVAAVVLLEYIDFKRGKKSFIFTKIVPLESLPQAINTYNSRLIKLLEELRITHDYFRDEQDKYHFKLEIDHKKFNKLISKIKGIGQPLQAKLDLSEIQRLNNKSLLLYRVRFDTRVSHILLITRLEKIKVKPKTEDKKAREIEKPRKKVDRMPKIAFIIDDVGEYDIGALELKKLNIPITASIMPDALRAHEEAEWIREYQLKAMIHLPMQPKNSNGRIYNPQRVITLNSSESEIRHIIRKAKTIIPNAEGINNHEGSLVTTNRETMARVLKVIKEEGLFFVDSRTINTTVAYDMARGLKIKTARKDEFLDHIQTYSASLAQIRKLVEIALQKGKAIGIGHPRQTTLQAIEDSIKYINSKGIKIVYVSELLE